MIMSFLGISGVAARALVSAVEQEQTFGAYHPFLPDVNCSEILPDIYRAVLTRDTIEASATGVSIYLYLPLTVTNKCEQLWARW